MHAFLISIRPEGEPSQSMAAAAGAATAKAFVAALAAAYSALAAVHHPLAEQHAGPLWAAGVSASISSWQRGMEEPLAASMEPLWEALDSVREQAKSAVWRWPKEQFLENLDELARRLASLRRAGELPPGGVPVEDMAELKRRVVEIEQIVRTKRSKGQVLNDLEKSWDEEASDRQEPSVLDDDGGKNDGGKIVGSNLIKAGDPPPLEPFNRSTRIVTESAIPTLDVGDDPHAPRDPLDPLPSLRPAGAAAGVRKESSDDITLVLQGLGALAILMIVCSLFGFCMITKTGLRVSPGRIRWRRKRAGGVGEGGGTGRGGGGETDGPPGPYLRAEEESGDQSHLGHLMPTYDSSTGELKVSGACTSICSPSTNSASIPSQSSPPGSGAIGLHSAASRIDSSSSPSSSKKRSPKQDSVQDAGPEASSFGCGQYIFPSLVSPLAPVFDEPPCGESPSSCLGIERDAMQEADSSESSATQIASISEAMSNDPDFAADVGRLRAAFAS